MREALRFAEPAIISEYPQRGRISRFRPRVSLDSANSAEQKIPDPIRNENAPERDLHPFAAIATFRR